MSRSERTNLPQRVAPGQEYRDVTVDYRLASRLTGEPEDERAPDAGGPRREPEEDG